MRVRTPSRPTMPRPTVPRSSLSWDEVLHRRLSWIRSPLAAYYLVLASAAALVALGLFMVLSASSVSSYLANSSAFTTFKTQAVYTCIGVVAAIVISRLPVSFFKRLAPLAFLLAAVLQALVMVPGLGVEVLGNRNWIRVGPMQIQPSEFCKLALILVVSLVLSIRKGWMHDVKKSVAPTLIYVGIIGLLIMAGGDLGTMLVVGTIYLVMLWAAGVRGRLFGFLGVAVAVLLPIAVLTSGNRTSRISAWLGECSDDQSDGCYQKVHGMYALADGGLWGVGPGASREKWGWLPEAHNDFIFAIIGEELGLPGALAVLALYLVLIYACYRIIADSNDMFVRVATAGIMGWFGVQAIINIGSVLGLLPIIGVPLPLISAGGSAVIMTLAAVGVLLAFARSQPDARAALQAKLRRVGRALAVLPNRKSRS